MKVTLSLLVCLFLLNESKSQILVGPVAGIQYSSVSLNEKEDRDLYKVKPVAGFHAGLGLSFLVRKRFYLHGAILYSTKGKVVDGKQDKLLHNEVKYRFIDIPVLYTVDFKAKLGGNKQFKYYLGLGPNISYWLGGKGKYYNTDLSELGEVSDRAYTIKFGKAPEDTERDEMTVQNANRIMLGLNLGGGFEFEPLGFQKIMLTARYEFGHSFFSRSSNGIFSDAYYQDVLRARNHGLRITLAYLIDLRTEDRKKGKSTIDKRRL